MDIIFGKLISDALKLESHRADRAGIQHQHRISPLDPLPGESVTIHALSTSDPAVKSLELRYATDGADPRGDSPTALTVDFVKAGREWDTLVWDYITHWEALVPPQVDGTMVTYCIRATLADGAIIYADFPDAEQRVEHATMLHFSNIPADAPFVPLPQREPPLFCYHVDRLKAPAWARDAILYHIYLDCFYPGDGADWRPSADFHSCHGGTLWGVRDKLDYLADLGINCLWLSPPWRSPSNHGYDVADYERIEPRLGGDEALRAVVDGAHKRGIRVLLDFVPNHLSNQHPIFLEAKSSDSSPYRQWFTFDSKFPHGYRSFFNVESMPKINLEHPEAREWMIGNAVKYLRDFDVDGYRLDVAAGAGPNFWTHCRPRLRDAKPDCLIFGEIIDAPGYLRLYRGRLDGSLDFSLNEALRSTYAWESWDEARLQDFIESHRAYFGEDFVLPSFLDNHDMNRFSFIVENESAPLQRAAAAQFRLPNPPIVFYGTEVGLRQQLDASEHGLAVSRLPMLWGDDQDQDLLGFYRDLIRERKQRKGEPT